MPQHERIRFRAGRSYWAVLLFFLGFAGLITLVSFYYLIPAMEAALDATQKQKRGLVAYSWLLLSIVLFIVFVGLMMTFRFGRFFQPRTTPPPSKTKYVDAWAESGKRISVPDAEDDEDAPA